jgi:inorganic pyrophosphatase
MRNAWGVHFCYNNFMKKEISKAEDFLGKKVKIVIDRKLNSLHPKHSFKYELNYGYVPDTLSPDGEELDAYVLNIDEPVDEYEGVVVAIIHRTDDDDDKLVVVPEGDEVTDEQITKLTHFQEQWFTSEIIR